MWKLQRIECENFISFRAAALEIPQRVCSLVYGINNDNDRQKNNGTGKSSIIEAIAFGLTGEPLRSVDKTEEIINDQSETAHVMLSLLNDYDNMKFTIDRTIDRKNPQIIECHKYDADGVEIEMDKTVQPTVLDYNRYILSEIGLSKDDIYSNFILSNAKYKSFFDASDKTKKAMINRFSGADMVDQAIELLQNDKKPAEDAVIKARENRIAVEAKIEAITNQLTDLDNKRAEWAAEKENKVSGLQAQITDARESIRGFKERIKEANNRLEVIDHVGDMVEKLEEKNFALHDTYHRISEAFEGNKLVAIKDYVAMAKDSNETIDDINRTIKEHKVAIKELQPEVGSLKADLEKAQKNLEDTRASYDKQDKESAAILDEIANDIKNTKEKQREQQEIVTDIQNAYSNIKRSIIQFQNQLYGAVVCPKCSHKFFIKGDKSVEEVEAEIADLEKANAENEIQLEKANKKVDKFVADIKSYREEQEEEQKIVDDRAAHLREIRITVNGINNKLDGFLQDLQNKQRKIASLEAVLGNEQTRIDGYFRSMIDEALGIVDNALDRGEAYVKTLKDTIVTKEAFIEATQEAIEKIKKATQDDIIDKLQNDKAIYQEELTAASKCLEKAQTEYDKYVMQENHFVEFRSYLANKKVEAISAVTNHFLELIGSDLRVEMVGFKKLKSGKIRDKITVNLLRNGVPCGSYARHSGGERARINLASILGLQKLTNNTAPIGKGLDLIVLDEILEASDTSGIESSCQALNKLDITSLMVTQNPVSDNADHVIVVQKENGFSQIIEQ